MVKKVIHATRDQILVADPTVLSPEESPDEKWHLFCFSILGLHEYISDDGENWEFDETLAASYLDLYTRSIVLDKKGFNPFALLGYIVSGLLNKKGEMVFFLRPFLYKDENYYYLFYEKKIFPWSNAEVSDPHSSIFVLKSNDLKHWSEPKQVLNSTTDFEHIACPCVVREDDSFKLYFSYDLKITGDNSLIEPAKIAVARSDFIDGEYEITQKLRILDQKGRKYSQVGAFRIRNIENRKFITCTPIRKRRGRSFAQLCKMAKVNEDTYKVAKPILNTKKMEELNLSNAYVGDGVKYKNLLYLYFNGRFVNDFFDSYSLDRGAIATYILVLKNYFFNREAIFLRKTKLSK